jgi:MoxR-like ATPase
LQDRAHEEQGLSSPLHHGTATRDPGAVELVESALADLNRIILGTDRQLRLSLACLLARGHLLIEDIPGVGKTTLAHALARSIDATFRRVQFTSDLLPSDLIGSGVPDMHAGLPTGTLRFQPGPLFANVVLADEINRASPKVQSALLEAMGERAVTVDGVTHRLPEPFFVVATQNPLDHHGTHPLPESQLDRFSVRRGIGYPDLADEAAVLRDDPATTALPNLTPVLHHSDVLALQRVAAGIKFHDALVSYVLAIVTETRSHEAIAIGVSPRGAIALRRLAQARALLDGRDFCIPEDVQELAVDALAHRIALDARAGHRGSAEESECILREILDRTSVPL